VLVGKDFLPPTLFNNLLHKEVLWKIWLSKKKNVPHRHFTLHLVIFSWCWWYRKYAPGNNELETLEKDARDAKVGLWADPAPIPPWVYRKARRGQSLDLSDMMPLDAEAEGSTSTRGPPLLGAVELGPPTSTSP